MFTSGRWLGFILAFFSGVGFADNPTRAHWRAVDQVELYWPSSRPAPESLIFQIRSSDARVKQLKAPISCVYLHRQGDLAQLQCSSPSRDELRERIRAPVKLEILKADGQPLDETWVNVSDLLDREFTSDEPLGVSWSMSGAAVSLWAPTAQSVSIRIYQREDQDADHPDQVIAMADSGGLWRAAIARNLAGTYYLFNVQLFDPRIGRVVQQLVTDPYSVDLAKNSVKSRLVDLDDSSFAPPGWAQDPAPSKRSAQTPVVYEMHIRDFTSFQGNTTIQEAGTFLGLIAAGSAARGHLQELARAGVTHIHLLPFNDFASVNEDKANWMALPGFDPRDKEGAGRAQEKIRAHDGYNWGYDPVHFLAPEGSYATNPELRVKELRTMVLELHRMGLGVVQDVVFNHTFAKENEAFSVLDRIVPQYYYRTDAQGNILKTSCCSDTASERYMMERLMRDGVEHWLKAYHLDGFRVDLMSFHTRANIEKIIREAGQKSGRSDLLFYGEGWSFGSLYDRAPREAMTQLNAFGSGVGLFNDRLRDAVRGGTTDSTEKSDQGWATGLYWEFNHEPANRNTPVDADGQKEKLGHLTDVVKIGLAGNLRDYKFTDHHGNWVKGGEILFRNQPAGYAARARETVNYVSAHDGTTLWDAILAKAPLTDFGAVEGRIQQAQLALATVVLSQGVVFVEGGSELLRSKAGDINSFDSGDVFNFVDLHLNVSPWGVGLPPAWTSRSDWSFWRPRIDNPAYGPNSAHRRAMRDYFFSLLEVRRGSSLFQLDSTAEIQQAVHFLPGNGVPGLIAMSLKNASEELLVIFNTSTQNVEWSSPRLSQSAWKMHPALLKGDPRLAGVGINPRTQSLSVPPRATLVLRR